MKKKVDVVIFIELDLICWLLNICGFDVLCLLVLFFYVIIYVDVSVDFFFDLLCILSEFI